MAPIMHPLPDSPSFIVKNRLFPTIIEHVLGAISFDGTHDTIFVGDVNGDLFGSDNVLKITNNNATITVFVKVREGMDKVSCETTHTREVIEVNGKAVSVTETFDVNVSMYDGVAFLAAPGEDIEDVAGYIESTDDVADVAHHNLAALRSEVIAAVDRLFFTEQSDD